MLVTFQFRDGHLSDEQIKLFVESSPMTIMCERWIMQPGNIEDELFQQLTGPKDETIIEAEVKNVE